MLIAFRGSMGDDLRRVMPGYEVERVFIDPTEVVSVIEYTMQKKAVACITLNGMDTSIPVADDDRDTAKRVNEALQKGMVTEEVEGRLGMLRALLEALALGDTGSILAERVSIAQRELNRLCEALGVPVPSS